MSTRVTLTIPDNLYHRAQRIAHTRQQDVTEVLVASIALEEEEMPPAQTETAVDREEAAFHRLHSTLWQKYPGQYVAIHKGKLVDHDDDQVALYQRVKQKYLHEFIWIAPVRAEAEEVYEMRSPRFVEEL